MYSELIVKTEKSFEICSARMTYLWFIEALYADERKMIWGKQWVIFFCAKFIHCSIFNKCLNIIPGLIKYVTLLKFMYCTSWSMVKMYPCYLGFMFHIKAALCIRCNFVALWPSYILFTQFRPYILVRIYMYSTTVHVVLYCCLLCPCTVSTCGSNSCLLCLCTTVHVAQMACLLCLIVIFFIFHILLLSQQLQP